MILNRESQRTRGTSNNVLQNLEKVLKPQKHYSVFIDNLEISRRACTKQASALHKTQSTEPRADIKVSEGGHCLCAPTHPNEHISCIKTKSYKPDSLNTGLHPSGNCSSRELPKHYPEHHYGKMVLQTRGIQKDTAAHSAVKSNTEDKLLQCLSTLT